ncbi:MAG: cytochrome c-type biogenesis protein CcdA [Phototrophicales bacterium]|nr:MAG: hypothetical protein CUN56_11285 [Phototrophicales bacterium]RMG75194.1 MAG: hypothetical protein D6711_07270 [Chloroflexota bacterium]
MIDWGEFFTQISLGNAAILTNVCLFPLYPGLIAFLGAQASPQVLGEHGQVIKTRSPWITRSLGIFVLAGVLTMMLAIGFVIYVLSSTFESILPILLPAIYLSVIVLGLLMLSGRNPFAKLATIQAPVLRNPFITAYVYGLLFGPMTLPCSGPIITTAFLLGAGDAGSLTVEMIYVIAFGIGFGWPLVVLPFFAVELQRRFTSWMTKNHVMITRISGILMIGIGIFGMITEYIPNR